jgi:hypothetical protein
MRSVAFGLFRLSPVFFLASCFLVGFEPTLRALAFALGLFAVGLAVRHLVLTGLRERFPEWFPPEPLQMQRIYTPHEIHDGHDLESRLHRDLTPLPHEPEHAPAAESNPAPVFLPDLAPEPLGGPDVTPPAEPPFSAPSAPESDMFLPGVEWPAALKPRAEAP